MKIPKPARSRALPVCWRGEAEGQPHLHGARARGPARPERPAPPLPDGGRAGARPIMRSARTSCSTTCSMRGWTSTAPCTTPMPGRSSAASTPSGSTRRRRSWRSARPIRRPMLVGSVLSWVVFAALAALAVRVSAWFCIPAVLVCIYAAMCTCLGISYTGLIRTLRGECEDPVR